MRYARLFFLLISSFVILLSAQARITRIVLIGNGGLAAKDNPEYITAVKNIIAPDSNTIFLFLGNNISRTGDTASLRVLAGMTGNTGAKAFFIPGYYDWAKDGSKGYESVLQEHEFIKNLHNEHIQFYPGKGCPGPEKISISDDVELVIMDSQWWLHEHTKPDIESGCDYRTKDEILAELEDVVEDNLQKLVLFATYHPFFNKGVHSGSFGLKQHIFPLTDISGMGSFYLPLPGIGSLYPIVRNAATTKQDMNNRAYEAMARPVQNLLAAHPNVIYLSGQERNMQLLENEGTYHIISGAATDPTRVRHTREVQFAEQGTGFAVLEISDRKKVTAGFYEVSGSTAKQVYDKEILDFSKDVKIAADTTTMPYITSDSFTAAANKQYEHTFGLNRWFAGNNYRDIWAANVRFHVFNVGEEKGGMEITGLGGGHQSKSLQLKDKSGTEWVLRTVNKNLDEVMPPGLKETIAKDVAQDMISASDPYGALVVPDLLSALHIVHATPQVVFVPNDTLLGPYRPVFANTVALLEERKPSLYGEKTMNSMETIHKIIDENNHFAEAGKYLQARFVDFLIADFDRHYAQWKWGETDTGKGKLYYPIPKDRDQALFYSDGMLMKIARKRALFYMQDFRPEVRHLNSMAFAARDIDRFFLSELDEQDWKNNIDTFTQALSDSVISKAVSRLPSRIYDMQGAQVKATMMSRRDELARKGIGYYKFLSDKVNVLGSNREDIFKVSGENGGLWVKVYSKNNDGDTNLRYSRWFDPADTKEIRLYGFNGSDYFDMTQDTRYGIKFRIVGGLGHDTFNIRGGSRNYIYDLKTEDNVVLSQKHTINMFSRDASVNEYHFRDKTYNSLFFPVINLGVNPDDGLLAGIGIRKTTYGFRQDSFASHQQLNSLVALSKTAYQFRYKGEFVDVFRHFDLTARAEYVDPALNYFFGYGNETKKDDTKPLEYYRTRYDYASADLLARKRFLNRTTMSISLGPSVYYYWNNHNDNKGRILEQPAMAGLDSANVYESKLYGGGKLVFNIDNVNNELLPAQGIAWKTEFTALSPFNVNAGSLTKLQSDLALYATLSHPSNLVAVLRAGGGHILNRQFEYFQAFTLGANNYLRGYRMNRFQGSSMAYGSAELRLKLFDFNAYVLKGALGIVGFEEAGRVWMRNERSHEWHNSYGGGVYITPFNMVIISAVMAFSREERLLNASLGAKLNLVFQGGD